VELIVVIVILGILLAISIPALTGYISKAQDEGLKSEGRTVEVALQTLGSDMNGVTLNVATTHPKESDLSAAAGKPVGGNSSTTDADRADWIQAINILAATTYDSAKIEIKVQYNADRKVMGLIFGKVAYANITTESTKWAYYDGEKWAVLTGTYASVLGTGTTALKLADGTTAFAPTQP
jgi:type II secretory pathway pseudopilin PulG